MAIHDDATLVVGAGNYFTAPTGTAAPANLLAVDTPWVNVGHTSLEDIFGIEGEGGEATVLGTLQNKTLRTKYSDRVEKFTFTLQQFDEDSLKLFFGSNMVDLPNGMLGVPTSATPTIGAFLAVFLDGSHVFAFYCPRAEVYRADAMALSDTETLAGLPLGVTTLQYNTNTWTYAVTPIVPA